MSMRDYAVESYGLLLNDDALKAIAKKLCINFTENLWETDKWDFIDEITNQLWVEYNAEFTGEAFTVGDDGYDRYDTSVYFNCDPVFWAYPVYPTLFNAPFTNIDDAVAWYKNQCGKYLPKNFNYRNNICHIVGTYYG